VLNHHRGRFWNNFLSFLLFVLREFAVWSLRVQGLDANVLLCFFSTLSFILSFLFTLLMGVYSPRRSSCSK
jgi:hypothetical protein